MSYMNWEINIIMEYKTLTIIKPKTDFKKFFSLPLNLFQIAQKSA